MGEREFILRGDLPLAGDQGQLVEDIVVKAGDIRSGELWLKLSNHRCRILGLHSPERVQADITSAGQRLKITEIVVERPGPVLDPTILPPAAVLDGMADKVIEVIRRSAGRETLDG